MQISDSELLLTASVARIFGVTPATVRCWERSGRLPAARTTTGVRLFHRSDVERVALELGSIARKEDRACHP